MADHGTGDDLWDEFLRQTEKNRAVREPSAAERARAADRPRRWPMFGVLLCCLTAVAGVAAILFWPVKPTGHASTTPSASASPWASTSPFPSTGTTTSTSPPSSP